MAEVNETVPIAPLMNDTENATAAGNGTAKIPATPEGMIVAYGSLIVMALLPIFFGAFRSVRHHKEQKENGTTADTETMTTKDAAMFPIIASAFLFGLYLIFQIFGKEYINYLLTGYFFFLGVLALAHILSPIVHALMPASFPNAPYHLLFTQGKGKDKEELMNYEFDRQDIVCIALCSIVGVWYLFKKHWIANNLFGLAFSINGVEFLQLNTVSTGCILLGGLFVYDIFWVFGTNVMVTVAKSFEAPIKLVFPQDILEKGLGASNFAMLGLGDIVIPGIFIALLLRFDVSLKRNSRTYFYAGYIAYILGLLFTILVMHVFKHAQPALLYLVPACTGLPILVAAVKGDLKLMFSYQDHDEKEPADEKKDDKKDSSSKEEKKDTRKEK
ncbi:signal peptide peptidase-like [Tubulanus polymorphus]|uniref:signal peptide peptidase-like n=1 Tax=Tubulanus polymorphus TaxID=672921 RepID=UPI003DA617F8